MIDRAKLKNELQLLHGVKEVAVDEPMSRHTSIGIGGKADVFVVPASVEELKRTLAYFDERKIPCMPVGNCTNLIVRDGGYRGALISLKGLQGVEIEDKSAEESLLYAEAGVSLGRMVDLSVEHSLGGLEFCAGIPGSFGGALWMNAGAYGGEMKDIVTTLFLLEPHRQIKAVARERLQFEYRRLDLPEGAIITGARVQLTRRPSDVIKRRVDEIRALRKSKHPLTLRSAGSVFKNPPGNPAGKLIEEAGLKGFRTGDAQVSEMHGNFIVNRGKARAGDVLELIDIIREKVKKRTGILLETEVKIIGDGI